MTISTTTNRVTYTGNGATVDFSFPYAFFAQADLVVIETVLATGVQTTKTLTTHYTISGSVDALGHYSSGGTVTALTAPASTVTWTIYRDPTATQTTDLVENDPMPAESIEAALDYQTMLNQRTRDIAARSLQQPEGDSATIDRLPSKVDRADTVLAFDSDGDPIPAVLTAAIGTALPISGGTLTGALIVPDNLTIRGDASNGARLPKLLLDNTHATNFAAQLQFLVSGTTKFMLALDYNQAGVNDLTFYDAVATAARLVITDAGVVSLPIGQLKFPAAQNASADANTLDDYEEESWTPSVGGTATYTTQTGHYTKIGRQVTIHCNLAINVLGTGSATTISGLPFAVGTGSFALAPCRWSSAAVSPDTLNVYASPGGSTLTLVGTTGPSTSDTTLSAMGDGTDILFSLTYFV